MHELGLWGVDRLYNEGERALTKDKRTPWRSNVWILRLAHPCFPARSSRGHQAVHSSWKNRREQPDLPLFGVHRIRLHHSGHVCLFLGQGGWRKKATITQTHIARTHTHTRARAYCVIASIFIFTSETSVDNENTSYIFWLKVVRLTFFFSSTTRSVSTTGKVFAFEVE